jgi:hypothetical protein
VLGAPITRSRPVSRSPGASDAVAGEPFRHLRDLLLLVGFEEGAEMLDRPPRALGGHGGGPEMAPSRRGSPYLTGSELGMRSRNRLGARF